LECYIISVEAYIIPFLVALVAACWIMLPAYLPNPVAAVTGGGTPVDFGRSFPDGRRVLGDGKTYRGFICGVLAGIAIGLVQIALVNQFGWEILPRHTLASI